MIAREKELTEELIQGLPPFDSYYSQFSPDVVNWLPFYWADYAISARVTYRLDDVGDPEEIWSNRIDGSTRRRIRKAQKGLEVRWDEDFEALVQLNRATFERQGVSAPYSEELLRRLGTACATNGAGRVVSAADASGAVHAALYVVWDAEDLFLLVLGQDRAAQRSAAPSLLVWEAIRFASSVSRRLDFEGSMLPGVEHFLRGFGGRLTPFITVTKRSARLAPLLAARDFAMTLSPRVLLPLGPRSVGRFRRNERSAGERSALVSES